MPQLAMRHLTSALADQDVEHLRTQPPRVRREVVWALEHLLWFTATWRPAVDLLLQLALADTETSGDNATNTLLGTFLLHLGGTATHYTERLSWWDRQYAEAGRGGDTARATLLARALAAGLTEHETRSAAWHGALQRPAEYRPSGEDAITFRGDIWSRLLDLTTSATADQDVVTELIAAHLRPAVRYPFADQVFDRVAGLPTSRPAAAPPSVTRSAGRSSTTRTHCPSTFARPLKLPRRPYSAAQTSSIVSPPGLVPGLTRTQYGADNTSTMRWLIDHSSRELLQHQVARCVRQGVASGELAVGEQLPPAVELAAALSVDRNTVLAAYRQLRDEGVLEFRRGRGARVASAVTEPAPVAEAAQALVAVARQHGLGRSELIRLIEQLT
jgi:DNA-binding transcriptional regulator YhcF (GntR family)